MRQKVPANVSTLTLNVCHKNWWKRMNVEDTCIILTVLKTRRLF